jgi:hypothetical protein
MALFGVENDWTQQVIETAKQQHSLFATCYSPDHQWLIAATDTGVISLFNLIACMAEFRTKQTTTQRPTFAFPVTTERSSIYSLVFAGTEKKPILMVGTDEETVGYDWYHVLKELKQNGEWKDNGQPVYVSPPLMKLQTPQKAGRRGRTTGVAETNALRCDVTTESNIIHAAAGDGTLSPDFCSLHVPQ